MNEQMLLELKLYLEMYSEDVCRNMVISESREDSFDLMEEKVQVPAPKAMRSKSVGLREGFLNIHSGLLPHESKTETKYKTLKQSLTRSPENDIEEYLKKTKNEETFSTMLLKYIDQTGLPDAEIYKKAGIDRRHFSKIRCDKEYRPKKATAMSLCLALKLKLEQVEEMLELSGYSLSSSDTGDLIVKFCVEKGIYDLISVNEALEYFGVKALGVMV